MEDELSWWEMICREETCRKRSASGERGGDREIPFLSPNTPKLGQDQVECCFWIPFHPLGHDSGFDNLIRHHGGCSLESPDGDTVMVMSTGMAKNSRGRA